MTNRTALVIGACSGIATAIARELVPSGYRFVLVARDAQRLEASAEDLRARGALVDRCIGADLGDVAAVEAAFSSLRESGVCPQLVLLAQGVMHENDACAQDPSLLRNMIDTNLGSVAHCALRALELIGPDPAGELVVISSVAGDRGRPKNYCYGATKAGLDAFLDGLRLSIGNNGPNVLTLKPGPVNTPMNAHIRKGQIWAEPVDVARVLCANLGKRRRRVYAPRWWSPIMWAVRWMPGPLLLRLGI